MSDLLTTPPEMLNGRYRLGEQLGSGGMAIVYRAQDETLDRNVAIKFLSPQRLVSQEVSERFLREAQMIARLSHPHILSVYDVGNEDHWHYLVLEYIDGGDLRNLMVSRGGTLALPEALSITRAALAALATAHQNNIIHRDIKPENIMISVDNQIKVMDFGLALREGDLRLTQDDMIVGTIFYMAPEIAMGATADARTDLYAAGVTLYEMITGRPPYTGDDMVSVISQILHAPLKLTEQSHPIPGEIQPFLQKILAKSPDERFSSADEALEALPVLQDTPKEVKTSVSGEPGESIEPALYHFTALESKAEAVEAERRRLVGILKGGIGESLNLMLAQANIYQQTLGANPQAKMAVDVLSSLARGLLQQIRDLEANLHPGTLENLGLEPALEALAEQEKRSHSIEISLMIERLRERLPFHLELALFRAVQEFFDRAIRRVQASEITVRLTKNENQLSLSMEDNGHPLHTKEVLGLSRGRLEGLGAAIQTGINAQQHFNVTITLTLASPLDLTARELEVLQKLAEGLSNKEIAQMLDISPRTVNFHLDNVYSKMGVNSRTEAVIFALRQGWIHSTLFK